MFYSALARRESTGQFTTDLDSVTSHLRRGDEDALREQLVRGLEILESEELKHGYRSDFGASSVSEETVSALQEYLSSQVDQLG